MFTVITPVYNRPKYLRQAVRSVLDQTFGDWEQIIIDDGSSDGTGRIADELGAGDDRISVIHQPNAGQSAARNAGIRRARGEWLTYVDSDDLWLPQTLAGYAEYLAAHPEARFIYGYRHRLGRDGTVTQLPGQFQDGPTGTAELFGRMFLTPLCVCHRRELVRAAGGFDEGLRVCEDYDLFLRMSLHCRFEPIGKPTGLKRRHATNVSRQTSGSRMLEAEILRRFAEQRAARDALGDQLVARRLGRLYYAAARQYFKQRQYHQAIQAARLASAYRRGLKTMLIAALSRMLRPLAKPGESELPRLD